MPGYKNVNNINADVNDKKPVPAKVQEREPEYKHSIVKSQDLSLKSIISHVEGSSWVVDYYSQVKSSDEEPTPYDINQSKLNQQYHLIQSLELKLQDQSNSTDDRTQRIKTEGSAVIYAGLIPNVGDVIIADVGAGVAARLTVLSLEKKTYFKTTVYEINFSLVDYLDSKAEVDHLNSYVVKRSVFDRDLLTYGSNPVVLEEQYNDYLNGEDVFSEMVDDFLKEFFSNELSTLCVPGYGKTNATYDPYVVEVFKAIVDIRDHPLMQRLSTLNVNEIKEAFSFSIWPVLLDPSANRIGNAWKKAGPIPHYKFNMNYNMHSFRFSGFAQCISPVEDLTNVDYYHGWAQQSKQGSLLAMHRALSVLDRVFDTAIGSQLANEVIKQDRVCCHHLVFYHQANPSQAPLDSKTYLDTVHLWIRATGHWSPCESCGGCEECCNCDCEEVCQHHDDLYYAMPAEFWEAKTIDSPYIALVRSYLKGDHISLSNIYKLVNERDTLSPKDRFYQMMVLMIILKSSLRSV